MAILTAPEFIKTIEAPWSGDISQQVRRALRLKKQISPELPALLDRVLADPQIYACREQYWGHIYASFLLTLQGAPTVSLQSIGDAIKVLFKSPLP